MFGSLGQVLGETEPGSAVVTEGIESCRWNGIDGVVADELLDVHDIRVMRILYTGTCPQKALNAGATFFEAGKTVTLIGFSEA